MRYKNLLVEVLIISTFWFLLHTCCRTFLEPRINAYNKITIVDRDNRDDDDTLPDINYSREYIDSGAVLFLNKCVSCHSFNDEVAGPILNDSISFKYFNESVKDVGDLARRYKHTGELFQKWEFRFIRMPKFNEELNDSQIEYIKSYTIDMIKNKND